MGDTMLGSGENFYSLKIKNIRLNTNPRLDNCSSGFDKNILTFGYKLGKKPEGFFIVFVNKSTRQSYLHNSKWLKGLKRSHIAPGLDSISVDPIEYNISQGLIIPYLHLNVIPTEFFYNPDFKSQEEIIVEYIRSPRPEDWFTALDLCKKSLVNVFYNCSHNVNAVCNGHVGIVVLLQKMGKESGNLNQNAVLCNLALKNINLCQSIHSKMVLADLLTNFPCATPKEAKAKRIQASQIVSDICCSAIEKGQKGKKQGKVNKNMEFLANHALDTACICFELAEYSAALAHVENVRILTDGEQEKPSPNKHLMRIREANEILSDQIKEKLDIAKKPQEFPTMHTPTHLSSPSFNQEGVSSHTKNILKIGDITQVESEHNRLEIDVLGRGLVSVDVTTVRVFDTSGELLTSVASVNSEKHCATVCFDQDLCEVKQVFLQDQEQFESDSICSEVLGDTRVHKVVTFNPKPDIFGDTDDDDWDYPLEEMQHIILSESTQSDIVSTGVSEIEKILNNLEEYILAQLEVKYKNLTIAEKRKLANTMADSWRKNEMWLEEFWENSICNSYDNSKGKFLQPKDVNVELIREELYKNFNYNPSFNKRQFINMCGDFFAETSYNYLKEKQIEREKPKDSDDELTKSFKLFWSEEDAVDLSYDDIQLILKKNNVTIKFLQKGYTYNSSNFDQYFKENLKKLETSELKLVGIFKNFFRNQKNYKCNQANLSAPVLDNLNDSIVDIEEEEEEEEKEEAKDEISTSTEEFFTDNEKRLQPHITKLLQEMTDNVKNVNENNTLYHSNIKEYLQRGLLLSAQLKGTTLENGINLVLENLEAILSKQAEIEKGKQENSVKTVSPTNSSKYPEDLHKDVSSGEKNISKENEELGPNDSKEVMPNIYKLHDEISEMIEHNVLVDIKEYENKVAILSTELKKTPQGRGVHFVVNIKRLNDKLKELKQKQKDLSTGLLCSEPHELSNIQNGMQALNISENIIENKQLKLDNESLKQELKKIKHTLEISKSDLMDQTHLLQKENFSLKLKEKELNETVNFLRKNTDSSLLKALEKNNELENVNAELVSELEVLKKKMEDMESKMKEMELDQILLEYKLEQAQGKPDYKEDIRNKTTLLKHEKEVTKPRIKLITPKTRHILYFYPDDQMQLPLSIVQKEYPETTAIKYRLTGGNWRMLILEQDHFHPPEDGWGDREYEIVNQTKNPNHSTVIREENSVNPSRPRQTYNHQSYPQQTSILQIAHQCVQPNQQIRPLMGISPYSPFYTPPRYSLPNHTFSRFQSFMNK